jgi:hypothetical protein
MCVCVSVYKAGSISSASGGQNGAGSKEATALTPVLVTFLAVEGCFLTTAFSLTCLGLPILTV